MRYICRRLIYLTTRINLQRKLLQKGSLILIANETLKTVLYMVCEIEIKHIYRFPQKIFCLFISLYRYCNYAYVCFIIIIINNTNKHNFIHGLINFDTHPAEKGRPWQSR